MAGTSDTPSSFESSVSEIAKGLRGGFLPEETLSLVVNGEAMTIEDVATLCEEIVAVWKAVRDLTAARKNAVATRRGRKAAAAAFVKHLKRSLLSVLGETNPKLHEFGLKPVSDRRQLTAEEKVARAQKAAATRAARGTLGKRQREKIKGTVPREAALPRIPIEGVIYPTNGTNVRPSS